MYQGYDYSSYYSPQPPSNPNPHQNDLQSSSFPETLASAPPFYNPSDPANFPSSYSSSSQFPNQNQISSVSPSAPVYTVPSSFQSYNSTLNYASGQPPPSFPPQSFDPNQSMPNYPAPLPPQNLNTNVTPVPSPNLHSSYPSSYTVYDNSYEFREKYTPNQIRTEENFGGYGDNLGISDYGLKSSGANRYEQSGLNDNSLTEGVYAYDGGNSEPYGARGTGSSKFSSSYSRSGFDDYGRTTSLSSENESKPSSAKIIRAVPKAETREDVKSGVQKFRVKLLAENFGPGDIDVLCQIGLDGIKMLDPNTNRTLRIYPLETITRWQADSSIYTFWSRSSVDIEPKRIRLQSNSCTTNTILDIVAAATVQLKEMGGSRTQPSETNGVTEHPTEKKRGFTEWVNILKSSDEEKDHWVPDQTVVKCRSCGTDFGAFNRRHHCRNCGDIFCDKCTQGRIALTADAQAQPVRVCYTCLAEVSQRLSGTKETSKTSRLHSHEDLARKLQEEMDRNRKASSGSKTSGGSGRQMKEVACPTCTVHLQVQVPSSGSETVECGVCQHPFLVNSR